MFFVRQPKYCWIHLLSLIHFARKSRYRWAPFALAATMESAAGNCLPYYALQLKTFNSNLKIVVNMTSVWLDNMFNEANDSRLMLFTCCDGCGCCCARWHICIWMIIQMIVFLWRYCGWMMWRWQYMWRREWIWCQLMIVINGIWMMMIRTIRIVFVKIVICVRIFEIFFEFAWVHLVDHVLWMDTLCGANIWRWRLILMIVYIIFVLNSEWRRGVRWQRCGYGDRIIIAIAINGQAILWCFHLN